MIMEEKDYFEGNPLGYMVFLRTYAKWLPELNRRENWIECVQRFMDFMRENLGDKLKESEYAEVHEAILTQQAMPSMRLLQFAGEQIRRCNSGAYNCWFVAPTKLKDLSDITYLSMMGGGVGFSVESQNVEKFPQILKQTGKKLPTFVVPDSKEGWADALYHGLKTWYSGKDVEFDYSLLRPAGARLKTAGGKSSGPDPLRSLLTFAKDKVLSRQGRRLRAVDLHDIICKIGDVVVSGGVRRSAMLSLSDLADTNMRDAKKGQFFLTEPHRSLANNSAVYEVQPTSAELMEEWVALMKSGSGERGIFNRGSLHQQLPKSRLAYFKKRGLLNQDGSINANLGTNPCGEVILMSKQPCNLSSVVARPHDTQETLVKKARIAAIIGTYQSSLTDFKYISKEWQKNCEDERLLGVSMTGQWDCPESRKPETLAKMYEEVVKVNAQFARKLGINASTSTTAIKPEGTVSQMLDCSSGIHPRHSKHYIRRIRISATDSLFKMLKAQGVPYQPEVGQDDAGNTMVLEFPVASPGKVFKEDLSALELLEYWKTVKTNYTSHNPSCTVSVGEDEWIDVLAWLKKNWSQVGGLSFLPRFDSVYRLAPNETITKERYEELEAAFPKVDYSKLVEFELKDETEQKSEAACSGGSCDIR